MKYRLGVANAIIYNNQILLAKRKDNNKLAMPGGKPEPYESLLDAAKRETFEETNLDNLKFIAARDNYNYEWYLTYRLNLAPKEIWITSFFVSVPKYPEYIINNEPHKNHDWKWYDLESVPTDPVYVPPGLIEAIKMLLFIIKNG